MSRTASVHDELGIAAVGDGYVLRRDGVATALVTLTPPDLRLYDADSLQWLLDAYTEVLRAIPDRMSLITLSLPLDVSPLIHTLDTAQQRAPDMHSYAILGALSDWLRHAWSTLLHLRTVQWLIAVPSVAPETPPAGTWGEIQPAHIAGTITKLPGDPIEEALLRARRIIGQLATLGIEPGPRLLTADEIRHVLRIAMDPIAHERLPLRGRVHAPRPLQVGTTDEATELFPNTPAWAVTPTAP